MAVPDDPVADPYGGGWLANAAVVGELLAPLTPPLIGAAAPQPGEAVLDVGCGDGPSSFAAARLVGPEGRVLGVDTSEALVARARGIAARDGMAHAAFVVADAATFRAAAPFDLLISRIGLMFFDDPVAAFRNLANALRPGGRMAFACWGGIEANPWFRERWAAARLLNPDARPSPPGAPGAMAFADIGRTRALLDEAGLADPAGEAVDCALTLSAGVEALADLACRIGPVPTAARQAGAGAAAMEAVRDDLIRRFSRWSGAAGVSVPARLNIFTACKA